MSGTGPWRRRLLWGGAALAALAAGAGLNLWRLRPEQVPDEAIQRLLASSFTDSTGADHPLEQYRGHPLVVNLWATWCAPCVEEMPEMSQVHTEMYAAGVRFLGLGVDSAANISRFAQRLPVSYPLFVLGAGGTEVNKALGNPSGALPYTVIVGADGVVVHRKLGRIHEPELRAAIGKALERGGPAA